MQSTTHAHPLLRQQTQRLLRRYLAVYPQEAAALARLQAQLEAPQDCFVRSNMVGHITSSAAILNPSGDKLLLIHHRFLDKWIPPGGHYEAPGTLWDSALREVEEETGLTGLTMHDWCRDLDLPMDIDTLATPANPAKGEGPHLHHDFRFLAVAEREAELTPQLAEVLGARWTPLAELVEANDRRLGVLMRKLATIQALAA